MVPKIYQMLYEPEDSDHFALALTQGFSLDDGSYMLSVISPCCNALLFYPDFYKVPGSVCVQCSKCGDTLEAQGHNKGTKTTSFDCTTKGCHSSPSQIKEWLLRWYGWNPEDVEIEISSHP